MTADQIIEVLKAWKEKKRIQYRLVGYDCEWVDWSLSCGMPEDFEEYEWRVKPEQRKPREWWIVKYNNGGLVVVKYDDREMLSRYTQYCCTEPIHVREVMDDGDERPTETEDNRKVWLKNDLVEQDYASLSVLPNYDPSEDGGFGYFYYASDLRKHPELRKYVIGG